MSRNVKLALMGMGGAAMLYSCAPAIGGLGGLTALPLLWGMSNPFHRPPVAQNCGPAVPGAPACAPDQASRGGTGSGSGYRSSGSGTSGGSSAAQSTSSRGGFGSTASAHGSSGSS